MSSADTSGHLEESELAALIFAPGQDPAVDARVIAHIATCEICTERLRALRGADRVAGEALSILDVPLPIVAASAVIREARRSRPSGISPAQRRAAGVMGFLTVAAVAAAAVPVSPLHKLIVRAMKSVERTEPEKTATAVATPPSAPASPGVLFTPGSTLEIAFARRATAGVLHVVLADDDQVSLSSPDSGSTYHVSSGRITVDQSPKSNFELSLPRSLRDVRVMIGKEEVFSRRAGTPASVDNFMIRLSRPEPNRSALQKQK